MMASPVPHHIMAPFVSLKNIFNKIIFQKNNFLENIFQRFACSENERRRKIDRDLRQPSTKIQIFKKETQTQKMI
jgi:hypothetical protein